MTDPAGGRRAGVWLGVDVGTVRVGVARSDPRGVLAVPVETVRRDRKADADLDRIVELAAEHEAVGVVVGLPLTLRGQHAASAELATRYGARLSERLPGLPVVYADERLSTVSAARTLSGHGVRGRAGRAVIDQAAAVEILQGWLDTPHPRPAEDA
ncbi:MAG: Holliday junction resolvase RuvX [bacterium]